MRTRGQLVVDENSRSVRSFVCTNTVVEEVEGKHLIKMMKKKFMLMINNTDEPPLEDEPLEVSWHAVRWIIKNSESSSQFGQLLI